MRTTTLSFGQHGNVTIHWEPQNDDKVLPTIQKMIDSGVRFFILETNNAVPASPVVTEINQVLATRKIVLPDTALEELHAAGLIVTTQGEIVSGTTGEIAKTAKEVAGADTVAVKPVKGG